MEINIFVLGDAGFEQNALERRVAKTMELYRDGSLSGGDGSPIPLDALVLTGDNFEDQPFEDAVKAQFEEAYAAFDLPFYVTLGNHDLPGKKRRQNGNMPPRMRQKAAALAGQLIVNFHSRIIEWTCQMPMSHW